MGWGFVFLGRFFLGGDHSFFFWGGGDHGEVGVIYLFIYLGGGGGIFPFFLWMGGGVLKPFARGFRFWGGG